jgi:hypothetical protein
MIRTDRVTKAYAGMKPNELAAIAFEHFANADLNEFGFVEKAVPLKSYRIQDWEYMKAFDGLFNMASYWAIQFWKETALRYIVLGTAGVDIIDQDFSAAEALHKLADQRQRWLATLAAAMETVCSEMGVDAMVVWRFSDAAPLRDDIMAEEPYANALPELTEAFRNIAHGKARWTGAAIGAVA